jgi:hypothetical protein
MITENYEVMLKNLRIFTSKRLISDFNVSENVF